MTLPLILGIVGLVLVVICFVLILQLFKQNKDIQTHIQSQQASLSELTQKTNDLHEELHEIRSGGYGVNNRIKGLIQQVEQLQSAQQQFVEQDPQSRFYNKAAKLISGGASLKEVMQECDMPAAEAELLFNLHKNHV